MVDVDLAVVGMVEVDVVEVDMVVVDVVEDVIVEVDVVVVVVVEDDVVNVDKGVVVDEDYMMNNLVRFGTYHRLDLDRRSERAS